MAGEWIKFESSLPEKPETLAITAAMGWTDPDLTVGKLMRMFRWFDQQTTDGNAARVTPALLDHVLGVTGLTQAVASVGWIVITDAGVSLSKFDRHNGESAKQRALTAKRVAKHKGNATGNGEGNAPIVSPALPKEEKRREEKSYSEPNGSGGKPPQAADEIIFSYGLSLLTSAGTSEKHARSFLGGLRKAHDDEAIVDKLRECLRAKPLQPLEWLAAALPPGGIRGKPNAQEVLEASNRAVVDRLLAKEKSHAT